MYVKWICFDSFLFIRAVLQ